MDDFAAIWVDTNRVHLTSLRKQSNWMQIRGRHSFMCKERVGTNLSQMSVQSIRDGDRDKVEVKVNSTKQHSRLP